MGDGSNPSSGATSRLLIGLLLLAGVLVATRASAQPVVIPQGAGPVVNVTDRADRELGLVSFKDPQHMVCDSGCGSPPATPDTGSFVAGSTNVSIIAGVFDDSLVALASGKSGAPRLTATRAVHVNLRDASGVELTPVTDAQLRASPVPVSLPGAVDVSDRAGRLVGKITFDGTQPVSVTFPTSASTAAVAIRCVNTAGNAFEACGGSGGGGGGGTVAISQVGTDNNVDVLDRTARLLGHVTVDNSSIAVTGTFWQGTQPVSGTVTVQQATASNLKVDLSGTGANATALKVDGSAVTQPVSHAGLSNLDVALSTRLKPADTLTKVATVDTITNAVTVSQATAANLKVDLSGTGANATALKVDGSAVTQPVSCTNCAGTVTVGGTVTANQGTANATPWNENVAQLAGASFSATNYLPARITNGAAYVDPTQIRTLTSGDTVTIVQPTAGNLNATVTGTVTANQGGAPWQQNVTQFGSAAVVTGTGGSGAGIPRMTVASDSSLTANQGTAAAITAPWAVRDTDGTYQSSYDSTAALRVTCTNCGAATYVRQQNGIKTTVLGLRLYGAVGQPLGDVNPVKTTVMNLDPCVDLTRASSVAISQVANTTVVSGVPGKRILICHYTIVVPDAEVVSWVEGTGAACATSPLAVIGGATAANGMSFLANSGANAGDGVSWIATAKVSGNDVCLVQSGAGRVAGSLKYAYQ